MKIEPQVPIPPKLDALRSELTQLVGALQVGDSIGGLNEQQRNSAVNSASRTLGIKVTTRKINGEGYRIWRTA